MREIVLAFAAMAAISVGSYYTLNEFGWWSSQEQGTSPSVRLDN
jgi:hypothetical protein